MRGRRILGYIAASGLALAMAAGAQAQDTGDKAGQARALETLAKQRDKLTQQVAAGDIKALTPLASKLEYGDAAHAPDDAGALDLYQKAADLGSAVGIGKMCIAYILGEGRPHDPVKGLAYCDKLTDDSPTALFARGYAAHEGVGETVDTAAASALFIKAVAAGSGPAADMLGRDALAAGHVDEARGWFRKGVYRESVDALDDMARMAENGQGGAIDVAEAGWLYRNAARHGSAHAREWMETHADQRVPHLSLEQGRAVAGITETYTDAKGQSQTRPVDMLAVEQALQGYYPKRAMGAHIGGYAEIDCYVNAVDKIDACWLQREDPPGYEFGRVLEQLYEGNLTLAGKDAAGLPTAQHDFAFAIKWGDIW